MNEKGLAAMSAPSQITVEQVVDMLMKGITPDEIMAKGVDVEVIEEAIEILMSEQEPVNQEGGLASMATAGGNI